MSIGLFLANKNNSIEELPENSYWRSNFLTTKTFAVNLGEVVFTCSCWGTFLVETHVWIFCLRTEKKKSKDSLIFTIIYDTWEKVEVVLSMQTWSIRKMFSSCIAWYMFIVQNFKCMKNKGKIKTQGHHVTILAPFCFLIILYTLYFEVMLYM